MDKLANRKDKISTYPARIQKVKINPKKSQKLKQIVTHFSPSQTTPHPPLAFFVLKLPLNQKSPFHAFFLIEKKNPFPLPKRK